MKDLIDRLYEIGTRLREDLPALPQPAANQLQVQLNELDQVIDALKVRAAYAAATPLSQDLERARVELRQDRTPAYDAALVLCKQLEGAARLAMGRAAGAYALPWAVQGWNDEVRLRPTVNVHRARLDQTWRTLIRLAGGDPEQVLGVPS